MESVINYLKVKDLEKMPLFSLSQEVAKTLRSLNINQSIDLNFHKDYVTFSPCVSKCTLTLPKANLNGYSIETLCDQFGYINQLLVEKNFFEPFSFVHPKVIVYTEKKLY
jgi:hypothetical protein